MKRQGKKNMNNNVIWRTDSSKVKKEKKSLGNGEE